MKYHRDISSDSKVQRGKPTIVSCKENNKKVSKIVLTRWLGFWPDHCRIKKTQLL